MFSTRNRMGSKENFINSWFGEKNDSVGQIKVENRK
jgi:hypothetical protein